MSWVEAVLIKVCRDGNGGRLHCLRPLALSFAISGPSMGRCRVTNAQLFHNTLTWRQAPMSA